MAVLCQERDLSVEKHGICQVRVVYFWASSGFLFTLDDDGPSEEELQALLGFADEPTQELINAQPVNDTIPVGMHAL